MANKKSKNSKNTKAKTAKKTNEQIAVESAVNAAKKLHKKNPKLLIAIVAIVVTAAIIVGALYLVKPEWFRGPMPESGQLVVHYIDVGQGDCIYIAFPDGTDMLIDCGSEKGRKEYETSAISDLKELNPDGKIDRVMATHSDTDHISYLDEVLSEFQVGNVYMPNIRSNNLDKSVKIGGRDVKVGDLDAGKLKKFTDKDTIDTERYTEFFIAALSEPNCNITLNIGKYEIRGQDYTFTFYCLSQEEWDRRHLNNGEQINAVSPIGILEYAGRRLVFTGDSNESNEEYYCETYPYVDCDVLKVAHHGSRTSSSKDFLQHVKCEYAVISTSGESYGHPAQEALDRLKENGIQKIHRTDKCGNVVLTVSHTGEMAFSCEKQCAA
ncbi:MAG: MBL fold metallo-hydrolase [Eubacteriales bacterium]|nr:MBL fold metallo-hydrolase [Eubacteriales bacterium]